MKVVITGSSGHLGEALVRTYQSQGHHVEGVDIKPSPYTSVVGSITDRKLMEKLTSSADAILHTATLHKPHVATHSKNQFIDVNVLGTQTLLEVAIKNHLKAFVYTSTTSTFGGALTHHPENEAVWVTEDLRPIPKNIYGVTKLASEDLCQLAFKEQALPCIVLKTSRFFPEEDDMKHTMPDFSQESIAAQEFLYRRVDIEDVVTAHQLAIEHSKKIGFDKFIISATTPFQASDCQLLRKNAPEVIECYYPGAAKRFEELGWKMFQAFDRVYVNTKARTLLGWNPRYNFQTAMDRGRSAKGPLSDLAYEIGRKGYHP